MELHATEFFNSTISVALLHRIKTEYRPKPFNLSINHATKIQFSTHQVAEFRKNCPQKQVQGDNLGAPPPILSPNHQPLITYIRRRNGSTSLQTRDERIKLKQSTNYFLLPTNLLIRLDDFAVHVAAVRRRRKLIQHLTLVNRPVPRKSHVHDGGNQKPRQ